ncbi:XRE family transcriptional regulator [Streptomyces sp. NPDC102264]
MVEPQNRTDLSDLLRTRRAELGLSLRKLAERCVDPEDPDAGQKWKFGVIDRLEKNLPIIPPELGELRALAAGLQVHLSRVQEAAGRQFFGIESLWFDDLEMMTLVHDYQAMSPADRERLREIAQAWSTRRAGEPGGKPDTE